MNDTATDQTVEVATREELEDAGQGNLLEPKPMDAPAIMVEDTLSIKAGGIPELKIEDALVTRAEAAQLMAKGQALAARPDPLTMIESALSAGHEPEKLDKLFDLAERYEANEARKAFAAALSDFQADVPPIVETKLATVAMKGGGSYSYNYADLDVIMRTIRPLLGKHGLSVRYDAETSEDGRRIRSTCYVMHRDGHTETTSFVVPVDEAMKVNDSQKMGSANAYACRYNVVNALGLTTGEDDDGSSLNAKDGDARSMNAPKADAGDLETLCPIGKHKGKPWDQVPIDYLEWMASNLADKPDIVERAKRARDDRVNSDDQQAQADAAEGGEMKPSEAARGITNAVDAAALARFWDTVPEHTRESVEAFYKTRAAELSGNDRRGPDSKDDDNPF